MITTSPSRTRCTARVWPRLGDQVPVRQQDPLGNPVVPLEYSSTALSSGRDRGSRAGCSVPASEANGVAPSAVPNTNVSRDPGRGGHLAAVALEQRGRGRPATGRRSG